MSRTVRLALMGLGLLVFAVLVWLFALNPIRSSIAETNKSIQDERDKLEIAQTTLRQAQSMREEGKWNQARLLELNKMVPPSEELPSLLLELQDLADQSGINFIAVTPGEPAVSASNPDYALVPLDLDFSGAFFDISDFTYRLEQMVAGPGRLIAIKSLTLALGGESAASGAVHPELSASMSLYAFMLSSGLPPSATKPSGSSQGTGTSSTTSTTGATKQ